MIFCNIKNQLDEENHRTLTSKEQMSTEASIKKSYEQFQQLLSSDPLLPKLVRPEHLRYLNNSLRVLSSSYECLDSSRPWLVYWILNASYILNHRYPDSILNDVLDFLIRCRSPHGGFGGGPGQYPHLATTYAAVNSLSTIGTPQAFDIINKSTLKQFLATVREENGAYRMHVNGELDVRGAYCAISSAKLANFTEEEEKELFDKTAEWIISCQTYEGGFGGTPDLEAHGGYTFCAVAALALLGKTNLCDMDALIRWTVNRQMRYEGGFQGRTNKLVDGCYSFWQSGVLTTIYAILESKCNTNLVQNSIKSLFNGRALEEYVLICCQKSNGGLIDKPGKAADLYHTCYTLSGLSLAQHTPNESTGPNVLGYPINLLNPIHPLHNVDPECVLKSYEYFQSFNSELENSMEGFISEIDEMESFDQ